MNEILRSTTGHIWAEIHMEHLTNNLNVLRQKIKPDTKMMAVVKADAYGHGAVNISKHLLLHGVDALAVASPVEGAYLRGNGVKAPILLLSTILEDEITRVVECDLTPSICTLAQARSLNKHCDLVKKTINVHIRVDIGLGSLGVTLDDCMQLIKDVKQLQWIELEGLYTHLVSAYGGEQRHADHDVTSFDQLLQQLQSLDINIPIIHAKSSPAMYMLPHTANYDMVRPGLALYGLQPLATSKDKKLKPVMELKSKIALIKQLNTNDKIGYGFDYQIIDKQTKIATIPVGYADGMFLFFLQKGEVLIHNQRVPIIGKVYMDHFMVNITSIDEARIGDEVVIIGEQGHQIISAEEVAERSNIGAMNVDCLSLLSQRVPRIYVD